MSTLRSPHCSFHERAHTTALMPRLIDATRAAASSGARAFSSARTTSYEARPRIERSSSLQLNWLTDSSLPDFGLMLSFQNSNRYSSAEVAARVDLGRAPIGSAQRHPVADAQAPARGSSCRAASSTMPPAAPSRAAIASSVRWRPLIAIRSSSPVSVARSGRFALCRSRRSRRIRFRIAGSGLTESAEGAPLAARLTRSRRVRFITTSLSHLVGSRYLVSVYSAPQYGHFAQPVCSMGR